MKYRRLLSFVLAMLMVVSLMPVSALAAGSKKSVENVQQTATIGGKSVKVQLKGVPSDTKLRIGGAKKASYYDAVKSAVKGDFDVVLAMNVRVSPSLKKAVPVTVTASAIKGLKASGVRLFNVADGKAREIGSFRISDKDLKFEAKAFDTLVLVKPVPVQPEIPAPTAEPTQEPEVTAEPIDEPEVTAEPTEEPEVTPEPTEEPEVTPEPTEEPEVTPEPTEEPEVTPEPTEEPEVTPEPTEEPEVTPEPTEEPEVTPEPTEEPKEPIELVKTVDNVTVRVVAPAGVLPEGTRMEVETASVKNVQAMVDRNNKINGTVLVAVDITFKVGEGKDAIVVQPSDEVKVSITSADMADAEDPFIVHVVNENTLEKIDPDDGALNMAKRGAKTVTFSANKFSVYAVLEPGEGGDEARVTVNFFNGTNLVATYYVKNSDILPPAEGEARNPEKSYIDDIVTDPGLGKGYTVPAGQVFRGWSMGAQMRPKASALSNLKPYTEDPDSYEYIGDTTAYVGADFTAETTPMTVEGIWEVLVDMDIKEGDTVNIYAIILKYYNITYYGDRADGTINTDISLGTDTVYLLPGDTTGKADYKVYVDYSPDDHQNFKGWQATDETKDYIAPKTALTEPGIYPNNTEVTISGDVVLYVVAPRGNWLTYNANARGATFNAPQFYLANETTVIATNATVANMERNGYTLEETGGKPGWYVVKAAYLDDKGQPTSAVPTDSNGYYIISDTYFTLFEFGDKLEDNVNIYAKWVPKDEANYTIIFHTQNVGRTDYDMAGSYVGRGTVGDLIPFVFVNNGDEDYVRDGNNADRHYTGFCLNHSDANTLGTLQKTTGYNSDGSPIKETVTIPTITPEGDAILNLYFDRIVYEFRFYYYRQSGNQYSYAQNSRNCTNDPQGNWGNVYDVATWSGFGNNNRPTQTYGPDLTATVEGYTAHYFVLNAYYGQNISSMWPTYDKLGTVGNNQAVSFVMMNGTGLKKKINTNGLGVGRGSDTIKGTIDIMDEMILGKTNDADGNFVVIRYNTRNEWRYHIFYEQVEGVDYSRYAVHDYEFNGKLYYEDHIYNSRSTNTDVDQQTAPQFTGFEYVGLSNQNIHNPQSGNEARWTTTESGTTCYNVRFYYDRLAYPIAFYDGSYVTGNDYPGNVSYNRGDQVIWDKDPDTGEYVKKEEVLVPHGAQVPDAVKNYVPTIQPGQEGYVFEGWYADEACSAGAEYSFSTVPIGGITVYAKWRQIRYRVFLHPQDYMYDEAGKIIIDEETGKPKVDDTLFWGSATQQMNFGIAYGGKISLPDGTRDEYEFLGWFKDPDCTEPFSESTELNETTVPADPVYDKETDFTDTMDKHGNITDAGSNSDEGRAWVTKKLDLYGKWRKIIFGAEGIGIIYDVGELGKEGTQPVDNLLYVNNAGAIAQNACEPADPDPSDPEAKPHTFRYWVVQRWDKTAEEYVDILDDKNEPLAVFPGDSFTVVLEYAKQVPTGETDSQGKPLYTYTMQLRAEYGYLDVPADTYINWYHNQSEADPVYTSEGKPDDQGNKKGLQINEETPIFDLTTAEDDEGNLIVTPQRGYIFIGWARMPEYDLDVNGNPKPGTQHKYYPNLTEEDVYLKYDPDTGKYQAKNKSDAWQNVTDVAADEEMPYHALYAVYDEVFYIVHEGTLTKKSVDVVPVKNKDYINTFTVGFDAELENPYTTNYYGGYSVIAASDVEVSASDFTLTKGGYEASYSPSFTWTRAKAAKNRTDFTAPTPATEGYTKTGYIYFIKEVPYYYLPKPKAVTVRGNYGAGDITSIHFLTVTDTNIYRQGGIKIGSDLKGTFAKTFTITQNNGTSTLYKPEELFENENLKGYFSIVNFTTLEAGTYQNCQGYWITYDNETVYGIPDNIKNVTIA